MRGFQYRLSRLAVLTFLGACYGSHGEEGDGTDATAEDAAAY